MEKRDVGRKSIRTVPVIIENHENAAKKTKLMVPSNYTAGQLVNILRSRMRLRPYHPVYLFLKSKQSPVLMSKSIGHLHLKHRDEKGLLRLIHAGQASFGFRGNIRAIRFRQKWIENLHNSGGYSGGFSFPPSYFPLEPPSTANLGAPLDVDDLNDLIEEVPINEDLLNDNMETSYSEIEDYVNISDMPSGQSSNMAGSSQSSTLANISLSSALTNSTHSQIHSALTEWAYPLTDPLLLSSTTTNSGQFSGLANSYMVNQDIDYALNLELSQEIDIFAHLNNAVLSGSSEVDAIPNTLENVQSPNVSNPQVPINLSLYDSDSEFYESDNVDIDGVDMDN